ncbi:small G protein signaling modulator 3 [Phyllostomus discolor]|uniref:Small G protein signaling modulator 3 n=1 Tax=Phyllostomus discolor TaxID=89673 RepID=A0A834B5P1_9CHIR|nr:small G protein signaling modulator 3 [Phyllostomus discolor]
MAQEEELIQSENSASIFNTLSDIPSQMEDAELLLGEAMRLAGSLTDVAVETQRRKHMAYIIADQGQLLGTSTTTHLSQVVRRRTQRRKSGITSLLFGEDDLEALKAKNIKQTELLADLREAILRVARHFQCTDPKNCNVELTPDYSMESHQRDHENYVACSRSHRRRAKALLDFERHDDDELGFRKNDIITIISQKDEHCWVGELNGLRGWFPAKFVEVLDERSKEYSIAGDDAVTEGVTDLVRGTLCPALKALFEHGLKKPSLLGGACHPWLFIEEAAGREVERDFDSVYSRLVLCKTYRLDEDGKVLTPEELLYRAVQSVNVTHDAAHAQMDVKLRSLICVGLNEQVLHLWLEVLCSSLPTVEKWYQPWSFLRSPGWVQIKCELRVLCCFAFSLSQDWELPAKREEEKKPLKEGVQDMLVKHHLFSWDIDG